MIPAVTLREIRLGDYGKKASFAALNWETQPRELYLKQETRNPVYVARFLLEAHALPSKYPNLK